MGAGSRDCCRIAFLSLFVQNNPYFCVAKTTILPFGNSPFKVLFSRKLDSPSSEDYYGKIMQSSKLNLLGLALTTEKSGAFARTYLSPSPSCRS